jgi:hypothetical protein
MYMYPSQKEASLTERKLHAPGRRRVAGTAQTRDGDPSTGRRTLHYLGSSTDMSRILATTLYAEASTN